MTIEERLGRLEDIESIRYLQAKYQRCYEHIELRGPLNLLTLRHTNILKKVKNTEPEALGEYGKMFLNGRGKRRSEK